MAKAFNLLLVLSSFLIIHFVSRGSNGLTIRLIHRDSLESPLYQPNLTYNQRIERFISQSKSRLNYLSNFPNNLRSKVVVEDTVSFLAHVGVGSFRTEPFKLYYFVVDSGSSLTWLECHDCKRSGNHCFRQSSVPFPEQLSTSYKKIKCKPPPGHSQPLCNPRDCIGGFCGYNEVYADNSSSKGYLAHETFTFDRERVSDLVFGCGIDIRNMPHPNTSQIQGILGLGWGARSFVNQLGPKTNGKFSYCLQKMTQQNFTTFLHFGDNIPRTRTMYSTPLLQYTNQGPYFVNLIGISVFGRRLNLTENVFARKRNNTGGCIVDSGTTVSILVNVAYTKLKEKVIEIIDKAHAFEKVQTRAYDLCYKRTGVREGFKNLPTVTFHFRGASLQLDASNVFIKFEMDGKEAFCLAMASNNAANHVTMIGAYQQTNFRFNYLTRQKMLKFGPENCTS